MKNNKPIIFFDGDCALCNGVVRFLHKLDRAQNFHFASLQGTTATKYLPKIDPTTIALWLDEKVLVRSDAVLQIAELLPRPWKYFAYFRFVPRRLRDLLYDLIANNRRTIGTKALHCKLLTEAERRNLLP